MSPDKFRKNDLVSENDSAVSTELPAEGIDVSLLQLIAVPERFHGRVIRVIGFLVLHFEGTALYLHREGYECGIHRNGIWVDIPSDTYKRTLSLHLNYVVLEGTFSSTFKGHMNLWSGSIHNIIRLGAWPVRSSRCQESQG